MISYLSQEGRPPAGHSTVTPDAQQKDVQRIQESGILLVAGAFIGIVAVKAFSNNNAFRPFLVSVGGVVAARGIVRFFS